MSTRAVIARVGQKEGEFAGVYHHSDGYPEGLGMTLFNTLRSHFKSNIEDMLTTLIDKHPAGWSCIVGSDFSLAPGYTRDSVGYPSSGSDADREAYYQRPDVRRPHCYCHGGRAEQAQTFTHKDLSRGTDIEWVYIFDAETRRMYIHDVGHDADVIVDLDGPEPDWKVIACGENFERCSHMAWYHNLTSRECNLSTRVFLGKDSLEYHDCIAFVIKGVRYESNGSGGDSDFYNAHPAYLADNNCKKFPRHCWIATLKSPTGKTVQLPVAAKTPDGYKPYRGVTWIFPPTALNSNETTREAE